jgi:hypothetical protein
MKFLTNLFQSNSTPIKSVAQVEWLKSVNQLNDIWEDPQPFTRDLPKPSTSKSVQVCPAAVDFDARYYVIKCPVDLNFQLIKNLDHDPSTPYRLALIQDQNSDLSNEFLNCMCKILPISNWRHPSRPLIEISTPFVFRSNQSIYLNQTPSFMDYVAQPMPGIVLTKRYPLDERAANLSWIFEWHDCDQSLHIAKGAAWIYASFETSDPSRRIRLTPAH